MLLCYIAIFMIDAVHILLLMRFCTNCIGKHRVNKKIVGIIFAAFFIVSCYLRLMPVSKNFLLQIQFCLYLKFYSYLLWYFFFKERLLYVLLLPCYCLSYIGD